MSNNKDKSFDRITKTIVNKSNYIAKKKIDKAQYDKSYNAVILGVNQNFVDDIPDKDKSELISKHSIPKTADNGKYYTFKINGVYYVKKSNTDFKLYEDVVIRVPNGNWNNMFIEVQRDTVNDSTEPSPTPSLGFGQVSFEKNRLYYNGETYYVQFGKNRRIVCVTKGRKYAIMKSTDFTGSRIEAATAVMNGLTEDWDLEFDYFGGSGGGQTTLSVSDIVSNYSGAVEIDWGDGTVNNESVHSYSKGCYRVKMKLLGSIPERAYISTGNTRWGQDDNERYHNDRIGAVFYIGGAITWADIYGNGYVQHYYFGESVRKVSGYCTGGSIMGGEMSCEVGVPPLVEEIGSEVFMYTSSEYIYIPESCISIGDLAFYYNNASEIEIEEKGAPISVGRNCFGNTSSQFGFGMLDILRIPARVVYPSSNNVSISYCCGLRALIYGRGITELNYLSYNDAPKAPGFSVSIKRPYFIFIPKTVTSIGNYLIPSDTDFSETNSVYIICEGNWLSITKDSNWDGSYGSRANVSIINNADWYNNPEKVIELLTRGG